MVSDYINQIRINDVAGNRRQEVRSEVVRPNDRQMEETQRARLDAQTNVISAERFRASLAPTGNEIQSFNDPDDAFFHMTCHIEVSIKEKIRRGDLLS